MLYKIQTKTGNISLEKSVISKIVLKVVRNYAGKVAISTKAGKMIGPIAKLGGMDEKNNIDVSVGESGIDVRIYVVIRFGTSIGETTEKLISDIKKNIEEMTDIVVNSVAIVVTGMISKYITKRNIEVKG